MSKIEYVQKSSGGSIHNCSENTHVGSKLYDEFYHFNI